MDGTPSSGPPRVEAPHLLAPLQTHSQLVALTPQFKSQQSQPQSQSQYPSLINPDSYSSSSPYRLDCGAGIGQGIEDGEDYDQEESNCGTYLTCLLCSFHLFVLPLTTKILTFSGFSSSLSLFYFFFFFPLSLFLLLAGLSFPLPSTSFLSSSQPSSFITTAFLPYNTIVPHRSINVAGPSHKS